MREVAIAAPEAVHELHDRLGPHVHVSVGAQAVVALAEHPDVEVQMREGDLIELLNDLLAGDPEVASRITPQSSTRPSISNRISKT